MSSRGQTCLTCDATCCRLDIEYHRPKGLRKFNVMSHSRKDLLDMGITEVIPVLKELAGCKCLTKDGLCSRQHDHKPKLCRSFWCGGKLWKPKQNHEHEHPTEIIYWDWDLKGKDYVEGGNTAWEWCPTCNKYVRYWCNLEVNNGT